MSYILDALRKSDQQRSRGMTPTLLTAQAAAISTSRPSRLAYASLGVVLLTIGIVIGWLRPWQDENAAPNPAPIASRPEPESARSSNVALPAPASPPAVPVKAGDATQTPSGAPEVATTPARAAKAVPPQHETKRIVTQPPAAPPQKAAAIASDPVEPAKPASSTDGSADAPAQQLPWITELPVDVQRDLPPMQVMAHAYSSRTADRLVGINNKLLHEGDEVAPGLKLEQITSEGMVLSFKGHVFRRGVH